MTNKQCDMCKHYLAIRSGKRKLSRGICLAKSVYASNKTGTGVYPAGARTEALPYGKHQLHIIQHDDDATMCTKFEEN